MEDDKYAQTPLFKMPEWHPLRQRSKSYFPSMTTTDAAQSLSQATKLGGHTFRTVTVDEMQAWQELKSWKCYAPINARFFQSIVAIIAVGGTAVSCWLLEKVFP
jgi:hypothetical protein